MEYKIKPKTWICPAGHINSLENKECPICKYAKTKEQIEETKIINRKKYSKYYKANENIK